MLLFNSSTFSQDPAQLNYQQKLEELTETTSNPDPADLEVLTTAMPEETLNLNTSSQEELSRIPFLSEKQIYNLLFYRETYGEMFSIYELRSVEGFDSLTITRLLPYITVSGSGTRHPVKFRDLFSRGRISLIARYQQVLQRSQGYLVSDSLLREDPGSGYPGSPQRYYFRISYNYYDRISAGIVGEKDPGEQFFRGAQPAGMDFYSGYVALVNTGILKSLIVGNFNAEFGQGLTLGSTTTFVALPSSGNLRRYARGLTPSLSANESNYLRGIAMQLKISSLTFSGFYSNHKRDGNILQFDTLTGNAEAVSSFGSSGYHRLPSEIADKNSLREQVAGGNLSLTGKHFKAGVTGSYSNWSAEYHPQEHPYNLFSFSGSSNLNLGADFQFSYRTLYGFGEISRSMNGGMAWLAGIQVSPDPNIRLSLICRNYGRDYQNLLCNALGQSSHNIDEQGVIFTITAQLASKIVLNAYFDVYKSHWLKYRKTLLSDGSDISAQVNYHPFRTVMMFLRYRFRSGQSDITGSPVIKSWTNTRRQTLRYQAAWQVSQMLSLNNRFEITESAGEHTTPSYGYLISQDFEVGFRKLPLEIDLHYALFNTDSYETAIYTYEPDVLYGYSVPALDGSGLRIALLATWKPLKQIEVWLRLGHTWYSDRSVISSGLDEIRGNNKTEIKVQIMVRL